MKRKKLVQVLALVMGLLLLLVPMGQAEASSQNLLKQKVKFINPEDGFTLFAFMNYTGYDAENHTSYHPVRKAVRDAVKAKKPAISKPNYFRDLSHIGMIEGDMVMFIGWLGEAPNFKIDPALKAKEGMVYYSELGDLDVQLSDFYKKADIGSLYKKYKPQYEAAVKGQEKLVYDTLGGLVDHFKLDISKMRDFDIYVNLQDMYWRGYMNDYLHIDKNTKKPYLLHIGPQPGNDINIINIAHEFSHVFVSPIIREKTPEFSKLVLALTMVYEDPTSGSYTTWRQIVDESFVRAMSAWATGANRQLIQSEVADGFIMTEYIYNRIDDFKKNPKLDFRKWVLQVMADYADEIYDGGSEKGDYDQGYKDGLADGSAKINEDRKKYRAWETEKNVAKNKAWTVSFDLDLDLSTVREKNIFVSHSSGGLHPVLYVVDRDKGTSSVQLVPARDYRPGETYTLWIKDVKAKNGKTLSQWTLMDFTIAPAK